VYVCPDHGCDPATGEHDAAPVPCVIWRAGSSRAAGRARFTERAVADIPIVAPHDALRAGVAA
jgi:hypothetical protein